MVRISMMTARRRWVPVVVALVIVGACSPDGSSDDAAPDPGPTTTAAGELTSFRLAAPPDCFTNPFCADGLARTYGMDVRPLLVPTEPGAAVAEAVRAGEVEVGVLFSEDPELGVGDLVVLDDDLGMVAAENVVPYGPASLLAERGEALRIALDEVSAALTDDDLRTAVAELRGGAPIEAAAAAVPAVAAPDAPADLVSAAPIRIGAESFETDRVLAHIYAAGLRERGIAAEVVELDGFRALEVAALIDGEIDLAIDYVGSLLEYLDGFGGVASGDPAETVAALRELLAAADYVVFEPAPAQSRNSFVVRGDVAERFGLRALSDLVAAAPAAEVGPPPGVRPDVDDPLALFGPEVLRIGSVGPQVRILQELLIDLGYASGPLNGIFEEPTRRAVAAFQQSAGLPPDGLAGPRTIAALEAALVDPGTPAPPDPPPDPDPVPPPTPGAQVHLTFDDGPSSRFTPEILDLLARYDARAVFFVIGNQVPGAPAILQRAAAEGHRIANHSWSHPSLAGISRARFDDEIGRAQDAVEAAVGRRPTCLRPPYGATDANTRPWAAEAGLSVVLWDVDPQDWARPGVEAIVTNVVRYARDGSVILMHDGGGNRDQTVAALAQVLEELSARGFTFTVAPGC